MKLIGYELKSALLKTNAIAELKKLAQKIDLEICLDYRDSKSKPILVIKYLFKVLKSTFITAIKTVTPNVAELALAIPCAYSKQNSSGSRMAVTKLVC